MASRKDYRLTAEVLARRVSVLRSAGKYATLQFMLDLSLELCAVYKADNPNFLKHVYLRAAGFSKREMESEKIDGNS